MLESDKSRSSPLTTPSSTSVKVSIKCSQILQGRLSSIHKETKDKNSSTEEVKQEYIQ